MIPIPPEHAIAASTVHTIIGLKSYSVYDADDEIVQVRIKDPGLGPCAKCHKQHTRYGPKAISTLCKNCR